MFDCPHTSGMFTFCHLPDRLSACVPSCSFGTGRKLPSCDSDHMHGYIVEGVALWQTDMVIGVVKFCLKKYSPSQFINTGSTVASFGVNFPIISSANVLVNSSRPRRVQGWSGAYAASHNENPVLPIAPNPWLLSLLKPLRFRDICVWLHMTVSCQ